jgi:hypothetical protein
MRDVLSRVRVSTTLGLVCLGLVLLAAVERRLWEADLNRADLSSVRNAETSKVVNQLTDVDQTPVLVPGSLRQITGTAGPHLRPAIVRLPVVEHPESRAPPR